MSSLNKAAAARAVVENSVPFASINIAVSAYADSAKP